MEGMKEGYVAHTVETWPGLSEHRQEVSIPGQLKKTQARLRESSA
jgi:hypothetical protein